jgi:uncharacterized protein
MIPRPLCIYHHACTDGFAAAWAVRQFYGAAVDFHPGIYGEPAPDVTGRNVILVDFSYKRDIMLGLIEQAAGVLIIDHHQTAESDLRGLPGNVRTVFDMNKSGAMLTWEHFFPGQMPPLLFDHVQDRDLWRFKLPMTREIMAAAFSHPFDFAAWDEMIKTPLLQLERDGRAILRKHAADVAALVESASYWVVFGDLPIPVANVPWMFASDVGGELAKGNPFAATYYDDEHGRRWSLRSEAAGADVASIAEAMGGGGHKHAAGFRMSREDAIEFDRQGGLRQPVAA